MNGLINKIGYELFSKNKITNKENWIYINNWIFIIQFNNKRFYFNFDFFIERKNIKIKYGKLFNLIDNSWIFITKILCLNDKLSIIFSSNKPIIILEEHLISFNQNII